MKLLISFFENRSQIVKIGNSESKSRKLSLGVPQGSILGPLSTIQVVQMPKWSAAFIDYYENHVEVEIKGLAMFSVQPICKNLFNGITGITTNPSEGLNFIRKRTFAS